MKSHVLFGCAALAAFSCTAETETASIGEDLVQMSIAAGSDIDLKAVLDKERNVIVTVDCGVSSNPDVTTSLIAVTGDSFPVDGALEGATRAGFWRWAGKLKKGEHILTVENRANKKASCKIGMTAQPSTAECTSWSVHRSEIKTAVHLPVGDTENGPWETLPASGNHWGAWAMWGQVYETPVLRGFYLHNLEHGGLVLSYGCQNSDESDACGEAAQKLTDLANSFGQGRVIVTPDPDQPTMYAVRGWRMAYASECLDEGSALKFMTDNYRHGREDIDADPPIEFDPTTTEGVPCENLMAAPDGC